MMFYMSLFFIVLLVLLVNDVTFNLYNDIWLIVVLISYTYIITFTLQHVMFYDTREECDCMLLNWMFGGQQKHASSN